MVGRDREYGALDGALHAARAGRGRIIVVAGEAGIGKSRLVTEVARQASHDGLGVLRGRCSVGGQIPYAPFGEALVGILHDPRIARAPALEPFRAALNGILGGGVGSLADVASTTVAAEGIDRLLRLVARDHGLVLVLEDLQWADLESLAVLTHLADDLADAPMLILATERSDSPGPAADLTAELVARRAADRLHLGPLPVEAVEELARQALGVDVVPAAVRDLLRTRSEGVPFVVEEVLAAHVAAGGQPGRLPEWLASDRVAHAMAPSYLSIVRQRLDGLMAADRRVVGCAAVIGRTFELAVLVAMIGTESRVLRALRSATAALLVGQIGSAHVGAYAFRHALAREAVLALLSVEERRELALIAAEAIEDVYPGLPGDWCDHGAELREQGGDMLGAVRLLHEAARRAIRRGALATAEAALLRARPLAEGDPMAWAGLEELLATVYLKMGRTGTLVDLAERVAAMYQHYHAMGGRLARRSRIAELHVLVARAALAAGDLELARDRLALAREAGGTEQRIAAEAHVIGARLALAAAEPELAAAAASEARAAARETGARALEAEAFEVAARAALLCGDREAARAAFGGMAAVADAAGLSGPRIEATVELGILDRDAGGGIGSLVEARRLAIDTGHVAAVVRADVEIARSALDAGTIDEADPALARALDIADPILPSLLADVHLTWAERHAIALDEPAMESELARASSAAAPDARARVEARTWADVRATFRAMIGDDRGTLDALQRGIAFATSPDSRIECWLATAGLLDRQRSPRDQTMGHPTARAIQALAAALALAELGEHEAARERVDRAIATSPSGWRMAHAQVIVAEAALAGGWGSPGLWAEAAAAYLENVGLSRMAGRARAVMRRSGVPVRRRGRGESDVPAHLRSVGVTSREMDVLWLVGAGLSNREIGERLFLSPRTVESHVASLFGKTQVSSRAELIALAARIEPARPIAAREH
jgi:DNA-binding CsgD family transcriptional regulator/tetratricopeptide (TPR) repeat protein